VLHEIIDIMPVPGFAVFLQLFRIHDQFKNSRKSLSSPESTHLDYSNAAIFIIDQ